MLSKKIFFLIDIDWTKEAWRGHLPSYHGYFIDSLLQNGNQVISISPNPKLVQEQLASMQLRSFAKLTLLSFSELKEKIYAPPLFDTVCKNAAINEASIKTSLSRRIKNRLKPFIPMRFLKNIIKSLIA